MSLPEHKQQEKVVGDEFGGGRAAAGRPRVSGEELRFVLNCMSEVTPNSPCFLKLPFALFS